MSVDLEALIAELREREDRRAELRRLLLGDTPDLQRALAELATAGARTDERLDRLTEQVEELAQAQARTEQRVGELARAQARTEQRVGELAGVLRDLAEQVRPLTARLDAVVIRADRAHGYVVERRYAEKGHAYFQCIARRLRRLEPPELDDVLDAAGLSEEDAEQVRYADAIFAGRLRSDDAEGYLVVETSVTVGQEGVTRAHERAALLRNAGVPAVGVVAGEATAEGVSGAARFLGVWQVTDGSVVPPDHDPLAGAA